MSDSKSKFGLNIMTDVIKIFKRIIYLKFKIFLNVFIVPSRFR